GGERAVFAGRARELLGRICAGASLIVARTLEAERHHLWLWAPVALGTGVACYFALAQEPDLRLLGSAFGLSALVWGATRHRAGGFIAAAITLVFLGLLVGALRSHMVGAPVLE